MTITPPMQFPLLKMHYTTDIQVKYMRIPQVFMFVFLSVVFNIFPYFKYILVLSAIFLI